MAMAQASGSGPTIQRLRIIKKDGRVYTREVHYSATPEEEPWKLDESATHQQLLEQGTPEEEIRGLINSFDKTSGVVPKKAKIVWARRVFNK